MFLGCYFGLIQGSTGPEGSVGNPGPLGYIFKKNNSQEKGLSGKTGNQGQQGMTGAQGKREK